MVPFLKDNAYETKENACTDPFPTRTALSSGVTRPCGPLADASGDGERFLGISGSSWTKYRAAKENGGADSTVDRLRRTQRPRIIHRPAVGSQDPRAAVAVSHRKARKPRNAFRPVRRSVPSLPPAGCSGDSAAFAPARAQPHRTLALGTGRRGAGHPRRQPRTDAPPADPEDREPQVEGSVALPVRRRHDLRGEVPAGGRLVGRFSLPAGDGREKPLGTEPLFGWLARRRRCICFPKSPQEGNALLRHALLPFAARRDGRRLRRCRHPQLHSLFAAAGRNLRADPRLGARGCR